MLMRTSCLLLLATFAVASKDIGQVMDSLLANQDKRIRPPNGGKPVDISVEASILDVYNFDELNHQVTLVMYFRQRWVDKRLAFDPDVVNGTKIFYMDSEEAKRMWLPDTFIANERSVIKHDFSKPNEFTRVQFNGSVIRSTKLTVTVGCSLALRWFPFDQNICSLDFESYGYGLNDVSYTWVRDFQTKKPKIWISREASQNIRFEITAFRGTDYQVALSMGSYSRVGLELYFKRMSFRYLLDVYFPTTAIPIVAFITLCVGPLHFRVLLSIVCLACQLIYAAILMMLTPKVNYKTALDFYVFNSSVTVFNVVLGFVVILVNFLLYYLMKPKPTPAQIRMRQLNGSSEDGKGILVDDEGAEDSATSSGGVAPTPRFPNKTYELLFKLCEKSYLTMPLFFIAFNLIYWPVVLIASSGSPEDFIPLEDRHA